MIHYFIICGIASIIFVLVAFNMGFIAWAGWAVSAMMFARAAIDEAINND